MHVQPVDHPDAFSLAMLDAAESSGLKRFANSGGQMMRERGGCAIVDNIIHNGKRQSAYRSYVYPRLQQSNLTVLTGALTTKILFEGSRATGIEFEHQGQLRQVNGKIRDRALSRRHSNTETAHAVRHRRPGRTGKVWHSRASTLARSRT